MSQVIKGPKPQDPSPEVHIEGVWAFGSSPCILSSGLEFADDDAELHHYVGTESRRQHEYTPDADEADSHPGATGFKYWISHNFQ